MLKSFRNLLQKTHAVRVEKNAVEAYDIWSDSYDSQPGNLMLDLDEQIFTDLLENLDLQNLVVADIGCGTGRHWPRIYDKNPSQILGFDVSPGMLKKLEDKFPGALIHQIEDDEL